MKPACNPWSHHCSLYATSPALYIIPCRLVLSCSSTITHAYYLPPKQITVVEYRSWFKLLLLLLNKFLSFPLGIYRPRSLATLPVSSAPAHSFCYHCERHCRSLITIWRAILHSSSPSSFELPTVHTGGPASSTYLHLFPVSSLLIH
jgi:hypothetical protein